MGTAEDTAAEMNAAIRQTSEYLESEVKAVMRGMQSFGITEAEARRILSAASDGSALEQLRRAANRVADPAKREALLNAINSAGAYRYRITRIEALNRDVVKQCRELYKTENRAVTSALRNVAQESYYREIFGIQQETGLGFGFSQFSQRDVERILRSNWAGGNYSQRIWRDINGMTARLKQELLVSMLTGRSGEKTARIFRERFGVNAFCARRIVRTESAYVANAAQARAYDEAGIERYRFIATLDSRTCECCGPSVGCGALDGKVFDLAKAKAGTNYPPMHPFCRCTTIADFGGEEFAQLERRAKDKDGRTVKVPAGMTYEEWRREFGGGESNIPKAQTTLAESVDKPAKSDIIKSRHKTDKSLESEFGSSLFDEISRESLESSEKEIAGNSFETAVIYDSEGKRIFDFTNNAGTINFTEAEIKRIPRGAVVTHNHPNGTVPSPEDVAFLLNNDISEIRACNEYGTYVIRKTAGWDKLNLETGNISKEFYRCSNNLSAEYNELVAKEGRSILEYLQEIDENAWQSFCDNHGLEFLWEERL